MFSSEVRCGAAIVVHVQHVTIVINHNYGLQWIYTMRI